MKSKNKKLAWFVVGTVALSVFMALSFSPGFIVADDEGTRGHVGTIESAIAATAPTVDGDGSDAVWNDATALVVTVGAIDVEIKSVYTDTDIYFLANWSDTTESDTREQWSFNATSNAWEQAGRGEDRLALVWNISATDFNQNGCMVVCHLPDMRTDVDGETVDVWHWKATRSNPSGWLDDKFFNFTGRQGDAKTSGGYSSNKLTLNYTDDFANSTDVPKYWEPTATGVDEKFILGSEVDVDTKNITEIFTNGTMLDEDGTNVTLANPLIPGHYQSRPVGSRGDVEAVGVHSAVAEEWTLEWSRALDTGNDDDLQFTDTTETGEYFFGVAVFDDQDAAEHATTGSDVFKLVFEQPNSPPSTPTITPSATSAEVGDTITFEASANDPDMDTLTYDWDFDDDSTDSGASVTHSFSEVGTYDVSVTASDGKGGTSTNSVTITIEAGEEPPPEEGIPLWLLVALVIIIVAIVAVIGIVASRKKGPPTEEIEETPIEEEEE